MKSTNKFFFIIKIISLILLLTPSLIVKPQNESFDKFISKFTQDSIFQLSRVSFPLSYISWDYEKDKECTTFIQKKSYQFDRLHYFLANRGEDAYPVFYDNFNCEFKDNGEMVFQWKGFSSGDRRYYFKRMNGIWILVKILDYDPLE
ncbi:MAG: DUF4348 domain-containing protein [Ignavibacteria bacterium]|nr:DUF4348 domain-containing protein [Ignavibacteria bacterium]